jgi:hypothetical protein
VRRNGADSSPGHKDEFDFMGIEFKGAAGEQTRRSGGRSSWGTRGIRRGSDAEHIRPVKEQHPELSVVPRVAAEHVDAMLAVGVGGAVVQFADEDAMRDFAARYR